VEAHWRRAWSAMAIAHATTARARSRALVSRGATNAVAATATMAISRPRKSAVCRSSRMYQRRRPEAPARGVVPESEIAEIAFMSGILEPTLATPKRISTWG
jgi:hypothetical protein